MAPSWLLSVLHAPLVQTVLSVVALVVLACAVVLVSFAATSDTPFFAALGTYARFCYGCFLKPHRGDGKRDQQEALESFYSAQASVYDATRARLLKGREDMLGLVAAQVKYRIEKGAVPPKPVWVDLGGGTGYNIEAMAQFVDVPNFFSAVYVIDLSSSLCRVAEDRFQRLGWKNVKVICQDARHFRLEEHEPAPVVSRLSSSPPGPRAKTTNVCADVVTMSYSLSMIPEFYPVIDSVSTLLSPSGVIGVADFYVQSEVDYQCRNYTGGEIDRHCMWISRVFWRTWFEVDRVSLEAARRDYLEYRFGTILSINARTHMFGLRIPYYVWVGCSKDAGFTQLKLAELNAAATESPFLSALDLQTKVIQDAQRLSAIEIRSKAYESAVINLNASLPLPASWYQAHHWRLFYEDQLEKHRQFKDEYIYAFTWEDARVDTRILKINENDVILAITSAGDNILAYALEGPKRIHAIDLNPSQNHLLELKLAAFTALSYSDFWKLFGEGKHADFRSILINKLSPHLSSSAFQYWLRHGPSTFCDQGLYYTGGSRHALKLVQWLFKFVGLSKEVTYLCGAQTLNEQREVWKRSIRRVLLSRLLAWTVISNKQWLWRALGVPAAQRNMIEQDYIRQEEPRMVIDKASGSPKLAAAVSDAGETYASLDEKAREDDEHRRPTEDIANYGSGKAIWEYALNTLDPVVHNTLVSNDNHYYLLCLLGRYTPRCHPIYLSPRAHSKLSQKGAFDGLRIHTDEITEVVARVQPRSLTIMVVMDSMDWFDPKGQEATEQVRKINRALKMDGRVLLRSAGLMPWYISRFEREGFTCKRVAVRVPGACIDRVNMYASTWICTKTTELAAEVKTPQQQQTRRSAPMPEPLSLGDASIPEEEE